MTFKIAKSTPIHPTSDRGAYKAERDKTKPQKGETRKDEEQKA